MYLCRNKSNLIHKGTQLIETRRLILRKFQTIDVYDVYTNWTSDVEAAKYNAWKVHDSIETTKIYLYEWIKQYDKLKYYHWAITDKKTEEVIGSISLSNIKTRKKYCEIGYTVARKYWNQGIATEALKDVIDYLINEVGFITIRALHDVRNKASGRVMEKAGMVYIKNEKKIFLNSEKLIVNCCVYDYKE
ncbi:GNAT family N-acetyltransferase [Sedimentibacter sp. MB31-C6]|uniref:GNAT family N-acetyltransferase n=1 Tax=Sedimentibacter sp. MB31-C6 TaxID=3109366 RepID=UPI002DDCE7A9|nr:GNAT family N-acetyltransferase [Sedimentibacter sp. MB36-C1]WSI04309.1 GNAT family N-acetyltransferase [Sedimentibacter sp. MB36-C1]